MILRIDRWGAELPPPSTPIPRAPPAVQELMGGKFGEMSTLMNYTFQSFNFRDRQGARPFYDLIANIAAEEFGHIELVAATINTMLTGASSVDDARPTPRSPASRTTVNPQHFIAGGQGALPPDSHGKPWNGDYVFSSGDLVEDLTHNFFLETGARSGKLRVYEMVRAPGRARADGLPARPRRRAPGRLRAGAREPDRRRHDASCSRRRGSRRTRSPSASRTSSRACTGSSTASRRRLPRDRRGLQRPAPGDRRAR